MKVKDYLIEKANDNGIAAIYKGAEITFKELHRASCLISTVIEKIGTKIITLYLPNSLSYLVSFFSVLYADRTVFPIMQIGGLESLKHDIQFCGVNCLITTLNNKEYFIDNFTNVEFYDFIEYGLTLIHFEHEQGEESELERTDTCLLLKTSGTTGRPNYVIFTDDNLIHMVKVFCAYYKVSPENNKLANSLNVLPFPSSYGNAQMLVHMYLGVSLVIYDGNFSVDKFWKLVSYHKVPRVETIPTMVLKIISDISEENYDISSLRAIGTGGSEMPVSKIHIFKKRFPNISLLQSYGMTEAAPIITMMDLEQWENKIGSTGKPMQELVEVKLADDNEILVKGKNIMVGYLKNEISSKKVLADGWLHTGDFGSFDSEGYLYVIGRKKNMIISGGYNIIPEEIERTLTEIDGIIDAVVYAKKHSILGECVAANIVLSANSDLTKEKIRNYCKKNLEIYKVPQEIKFVEQIERNITGKIRRINCE